MDRHHVVTSCQEYRHHLAYIAILLVERWLGKTDKVKSASILDLAFDVPAGILKLLSNKLTKETPK